MTNIPLADRQKFIGASEVGALFGLSPHATLFELWHRKAGNIPVDDLSNNERVFWGQVLEPAIAAGVAQVKGWRCRKVRRYIAHPTVEGMGASLDYEIIGDLRGAGVLEIKTADFLAFRGWPEQKPPMHYQLQLQHQLSVTGRQWGAIGVLVGGNTLHVFEFARHSGAIAKIEAAIKDFWQSVHDNKPPAPDFQADAATISRLYMDADGDPLDMSSDNRLTELCALYADASQQEKAAKKNKDAAKAEILTKIGSAPKVFLSGFSISATAVPSKQIAFERPAYRDFRITAKGPTEQGVTA